MDALCIDQSTTQEKSHQVGMMSQIYARSVHVLACVGPRRTEVIEYRSSYKADGTYYWPYKDDVAYPPYQDDSTLLFRFIDRHRLLLASIHRLTLRPGFEQSRNWVEPNPIPKSSWIALRCLCAFSPRLRQTVATKFFTFMKRPYFSRVWVLQELHLAPNISLCCGTDVRSFDYLLAVSMLVDLWINISDYGKSLSFTVSFTEKLFSWQPWFWRRQESCATDTFKENLRAIQNQRGCLSLASGTGGRRRLAVVLDVMHSFNCTDARDRLFGVLALVDWGRGKTVIPDYEKDSYQLAVEVLQLYLENPRTRPVSGMAIEWSRQLWEIFGVDIQGQAIQNAKLKRYNGDPIPYHDSPLLIEFDPPHISESFRGVNGTTMYPSMYLDDRSVRSRDIWYGVRLLENPDIRKATVDSGDSPLRYLWCEEYDSPFASRVMPPLVKILDQEKRSFAWAPADTKPNDWLLFSGASTWYNRSPAMVVVRDGDPNLGTFDIVGQASRNPGYPYGYEYEKCILASLQWRYFESNWHAEDLFFFDWNHKNRSFALVACRPTMVETWKWLKMEVCAYKGSSFFKGPRNSLSDHQEHAVKVVNQWTGRYASRQHGGATPLPARLITLMR
jgi:hypothetical protein